MRLLRREEGLRLGDLGINNLLEACAAQRMVILSIDELAHLPNCSGARMFPGTHRLARAATAEEVRASVEAIRSVRVLYPGVEMGLRPMDLLLDASRIDERCLNYRPRGVLERRAF